MSQPKPNTTTGAKIDGILKYNRMKVLVTRCIVIAFFIVLALFIALITGLIKSEWQTKVTVGVLEGVLTRTMYPLVKHYLPAKKEADAAEEREANQS